MVHRDGVDGPEEHPDEGDGYGAADEGGDEPNDELEAAGGRGVMSVVFSTCVVGRDSVSAGR